MVSPSKHVVNDLIHDIPVSVTYCSITHCVRAFTAAARGEALKLHVGGLKDSRMLLSDDEHHTYRQETAEPVDPQSPPLPFEPHPFEVTTWKEWRAANPDTDIYVGTDRDSYFQPGGGRP